MPQLGCRKPNENSNSIAANTTDFENLSRQGIKFNPDKVVIPGKRVGMITAQTKREDLLNFLPAEQLTDSQLLNDQQQPQNATTYTIDNRNKIIIFWTNKDRSHAQMVLIKGERNDYTTPEGIFVGASMDEVVQANQDAFQFRGFTRNEWGKGGEITSFANGKLQQYAGKWQVQMQFDGREELAELSLDKFPANATHSSAQPDAALLTMTVAQMWVYLGK